MALKLKLSTDEYGKLDDSLKSFYAADGANFVLAVEGLPDNSGLMSALEKTRKELKDVRGQLDKVKDIDPEKYQSLLDRQAELELKEKEAKGEWESAKQQMLTSHKGELDAERKKTLSFEDKWKKEHALRINEMIEREALTAISDAKGNRTLLLPQLRAHMRVLEEDGKPPVVQIFDPAENKPYVGGDGKPLNARGLLDKWRDSDDYAGAFAGTGSSGSGAPGNSRFGGNGAAVLLTRDEARDPQRYRQARDQAIKEGKELQITN